MLEPENVASPSLEKAMARDLRRNENGKIWEKRPAKVLRALCVGGSTEHYGQGRAGKVAR
jgi:hypothetical protein